MENTEFEGTPGIWSQSHRICDDDFYRTQVYSDNGIVIADIEWYPMPPRIEVIEGKERNVIGTYREANAQLIAAAPELLKALQDILKRTYVFEGLKKENAAGELAINKALGKSE